MFVSIIWEHCAVALCYALAYQVTKSLLKVNGRNVIWFIHSFTQTVKVNHFFLFIFFAVKPTSVTILEKQSFVSAGREIKVVCQSLGGYPPPKLTWWLGSKMLKSNEEV